MSNRKEPKKSSFFPRDWLLEKVFICETLYVLPYEHVHIVSFNVSYKKLWLEENGDQGTDRSSYSFKFIQSKTQNEYKMLSSFRHNFVTNPVSLKIFAYS